MINLHTHTNCSDGVLEPVELLKKLEQNKIKIVSITDHDTVDAYIALRKVNLSDYYTGKLIPGVEVKCNHNGYPIEILGYYIDIDRMKPYLDQNRIKIAEFQKYAFTELVKVCQRLNLKYDDYELRPEDYASNACFNMLNKYYDYNVKILGSEVLENQSIFFRQAFSNPKSPFFILETGLIVTAKEAVEKIHQFGGLAFIAHIGYYKAINDKIDFLEDLYQKTGIDGVECYYSLHTEEETNQYLTFCHQHHLLVSGGSDYHGLEHQNIIKQDNIDLREVSWINDFSK